VAPAPELVRGHNAGGYAGVPAQYCERRLAKWLFYAPSLRRTLLAAAAEADILHLHGLWNAVIWESAAVARHSGRRYVLSPRGMLEPAALAHDRLRKRAAWLLFDRRTVEGAALLDATSPTESATLERLAPGRVRFVANGVDDAAAPPPALDVRARYGIAAGAPIVLFLGRLHPIKRLDLVALAFTRLRALHPAAHLVMAGPDEAGTRASLAPLFAPLAAAVTWAGEVDDSIKAALLAAASALAVCSNSESFGMGVAEALAAGTPVVVTRTLPWEDVESHGAGFWVEQTPDAIAAGLAAIIEDPAAARAMGARGRSLAQETYNWHKSAAALQSAYAEVLAASRV
jgi:glycosyltransferase involved in cell wall biosynthesis